MDVGTRQSHVHAERGWTLQGWAQTPGHFAERIVDLRGLIHDPLFCVVLPLPDGP